MSKAIVISAALFFFGMILVTSGVVDALIIFLLSGALPGTSFQIPPGVMLVGFFSIGWILAARFISHHVAHFYEVHLLTKRYAARQASMPKRRYSRI